MGLKNHSISIDERIMIRLNKKKDIEISMKIILADKSIEGLLCL